MRNGLIILFIDHLKQLKLKTLLVSQLISLEINHIYKEHYNIDIT